MPDAKIHSFKLLATHGPAMHVYENDVQLFLGGNAINYVLCDGVTCRFMVHPHDSRHVVLKRGLGQTGLYPVWEPIVFGTVSECAVFKTLLTDQD
ncbi:hypothetical protein TNCV_5120701 [Trichonephila clavipes]|nr:hypothetical protein TNCV_5120701 [Trichonephila clavipes]